MNVCVYCGSSSRVNLSFLEAARRLGHIFAAENVGLVYGAGALGLMGEVANAVLARGGRVTGVIPRFMVEEGWQHHELEQVHVTENMHERKQKMAQLADAVVALPGGCGTFEELLEIITWKQLGLYLNPIIILNTNAYFDPLIEMLERAAEQHFMRSEHLNMWKVVDTPDAVLPAIRSTSSWDTNCRKFAAL